MTVTDILLAAADFSHARLLGSLDAIAKFPDPQYALAYRPGPGRAHPAWQFMHTAATLHKYVNFVQNKPAGDEALIAGYGGGSTPSDANIPALGAIRATLERDYATFRAYIAAQTPQSLAQQVTTPGNKQRTVLETIVLLTWHDAHHQGQIHLTLNLFKAEKGL